MHKTMIRFTNDGGDPVLLDVDDMLVVEPVFVRQDDGTMANMTLITFKGGAERTVRETFDQVVQRLIRAVEVAFPSGPPRDGE